MTRVDDAFGRLKSNLEITATEASQAAKRHGLIRGHIRSRWSLSDDFLTGSYDRHTKTKKLKDVDIFVVIDPEGPQANLADGTGRAAVRALADILSTRWSVTTDDNVALISYSDEEVASYEIAPVFAVTDGYLIPNGSTWMRTNPSVHADLVTSKNTELGGKFVPLVKMIKAVNRQHDEPVTPSFLLEVMALQLIEPAVTTYREELSYFFAAAVDGIYDMWPDPAHLGDNVDASMVYSDRQQVSEKFRQWQLIAENALRLEDRGDESAAVEEWRKLFGSRMPRS